MDKSKLGKIAFFKAKRLENGENNKIKKLEEKVKKLENSVEELKKKVENLSKHVHTYKNEKGETVDTGGVK